MKVFYNGIRLKDVYPHATRWQVVKYRIARWFRKVVILILFVLAAYGLAFIFWNPTPQIIYSAIEVAEKPTPVLERIAKCESGGKHFENGQVLVRGNTNKSVDVGKFQINMSLWGKKATELGYNLMDEKGNEAFAKWLYANRGTEDWIWSKDCWR